ncbi:MIP/aquaporin family protein [Acholeplasma granularum]|uniref:MIP/aquaporin family protein n=1 Tax=Acholeplasma granularum TaxID=264635 RepID=UPI0004B019AE|nr:aquaporin [Acholeplasma granularum]
MNMKAYIAEFIGTFSLVLVGLTAAVLNLELSSIGLAFGLILMAMIYTLGNSSGGHFNPAVTFGMALTKRLSWKDFGLYIIAQLLGSLFAVLCLVPFIGSLDNLAANQVLTDFGVQTDLLVLLLALLVEVIATFIFVFVILRVTKEKTLHMVSGLIIGLTLTALIYFTGNLTNASINPARSIFPALFQGGKALNELWIFIIGPMIGAFLASVAAPYFDSENS